MRLSSLTHDERELFEERAAIREYHGNQSRADAEAGALAEIVARRRRPKARAPLPKVRTSPQRGLFDGSSGTA